MKSNAWYILIIMLVCTLLAFIIISDTHTNYLEKENEILRNELNMKNGKQWERNIQQNMEKDQPIYF